MAMHGSNGVGCSTPMTGAARRAAAAATSGCHLPELAPPPAGRRAGQSNAAAASGGAPIHDCARPPVRGGGAPAVPAGANPAVSALVGMLGDAAPPARPPSALQVFAGQISSLLGAISARLAALTPEATADAGAGAGSTVVDDPGSGTLRAEPSLLRQPPPPAGPVLSLDPLTGTIVDPMGSDPDGGTDGGSGALPDDRDANVPSSWVPVPGAVLRRVQERLGSLADRIDALLAEVGMTRMQLLMLTVLGPVAVAFLIDVVAQLLAAR